MEEPKPESQEDTGIFYLTQSASGAWDLYTPCERENFFHNFIVPLVDHLWSDDSLLSKRRWFRRKENPAQPHLSVGRATKT